MELQVATKLGIDAAKSFADGLLNTLDLGIDVAQDGFSADDLMQAIRVPGIVSDLQQAPLAVAQLKDLDESEELELTQHIKNKVETLNDGLKPDRIEKIAGLVLQSVINLILTINLIKKS
ncbi:MAG: hypothetical protein AAF634_13150 [Bacteroidota bacterium]